MHLWFKRARFNESYFGSPGYHRERVAVLGGYEEPDPNPSLGTLTPGADAVPLHKAGKSIGYSRHEGKGNNRVEIGRDSQPLISLS